MLKIGVLASGRGSNLQSIIESIKEGRLKAEIKVVISDREKAKALSRAEDNGITGHYLNPAIYKDKRSYEKAMIDILNKNKIDLVVMAGFMRLLSPFFIRTYRKRIMNIHPSLLPSFPGLDPQKQALEHGVKISGCTVHFADEGMDTGPIILQAAVPVKEDDTVDSLSSRILEEEHRLYPEAIRLYSQGKLRVNNGRVEIAID